MIAGGGFPPRGNCKIPISGGLHFPCKGHCPVAALGEGNSDRGGLFSSIGGGRVRLLLQERQTAAPVRSPVPFHGAAFISLLFRPRGARRPSDAAYLLVRDPSSASKLSRLSGGLFSPPHIKTDPAAAVLDGPYGPRLARLGDTIPGIGRVDSIVRWGNRWILATSKGLIATP